MTSVMMLMVLAAFAGHPQTPKTPQDPDLVTHFNARISAYVELRSELEKGLPARTSTANPAEIRMTARALATRIRAARAKARLGDIFTPAIGVEFRKALLREMTAHVWKVIMDDNPGDFEALINGAYPEGKILSTVPPNILAVLPRLPVDLEYRFVGRHLILLDTRAMVILDRIPYAIQSPAARGRTGQARRARTWRASDSGEYGFWMKPGPLI